MNLSEILATLADPYSQAMWESAYDALDELPPISDTDLILIFSSLSEVPECDYSLLRLFCLDLLDRDSIEPSRYFDSIIKVIENGNDTERSMALQFVRSTEVEYEKAILIIETILAEKLPLLFKWQLKRTLKDLEKRQKGQT